MTLPTTKPNDPDLPWYIAECMDLKKHLAIECAAKHEYLRMINELKVKAGFYEREIARLRAENAALREELKEANRLLHIWSPDSVQARKEAQP